MDNREFFNSVAHKWDGMCSHDDNKLKKIIELSKVKPGSSILDIGTGTGILVSYLLNTEPQKVTAVDISENMIEVARGKYNDCRVEFIVSDIMEYPKGGYDYTFIYSAYPHFDDKDGLFEHIYQLMNRGGRIVIAHSESKEKINEIHKSNNHVADDVLPPGDITAGIMSKYFTVDNVIDNADMYYVSGVKL